eukprot:1216387-Prymnesium_polylepis.1
MAAARRTRRSCCPNTARARRRRTRAGPSCWGTACPRRRRPPAQPQPRRHRSCRRPCRRLCRQPPLLC